MIIFTFGNRPYCFQWALDFILLFYCFVASCCVVFVLLFMLFIAALRMYIHEFCYNIDRHTVVISKNFNKGSSTHNHAHSLGVAQLEPRPCFQRWKHDNLV